MKSQLSLVLLALSAPAFAAQSTRLGDLNFFPKDNSIYWNTQLTQTSQEYKNTYGVGNSFENETSALNWQNTVLYALTDRLNLGASFNYDIRNKTENNKNTFGGTDQIKNKSFESTGLSDFTVNANYRLMNENLFVDLIGGITFGMGEKETGISTQTRSNDGNNKQGHHSVLLGVAAGQKNNEWEWRTRAFFDYHLSGERTTYGASNAKIDLDTDSYTVMGIDVRGQYRFMKNFAIEGLVGFNRVSEVTESGSDAGQTLDIDRDSYNTIQYGFTGKYNVSDALLVKAGVLMTAAHDEKGSSKLGFGTSNSTKLEYEPTRALFVGGEFLF